MSAPSIIIALLVPFLIGLQLVDKVHGDDEAVLQDTDAILNPFHNADLDISLAQLKSDEILELLAHRLKDTLRDQREPKMIFEEYSDQDIAEACATFSSIECGEKVLQVLGTNSVVSIQKKCKVRKEFLECIDFQRRTCKELANNKLFPVLPPKKNIRETQEKVWRTLWTSGACTLAV